MYTTVHLWMYFFDSSLCIFPLAVYGGESVSVRGFRVRVIQRACCSPMCVVQTCAGYCGRPFEHGSWLYVFCLPIIDLLYHFRSPTISSHFGSRKFLCCLLNFFWIKIVFVHGSQPFRCGKQTSTINKWVKNKNMIKSINLCCWEPFWIPLRGLCARFLVWATALGTGSGHNGICT